MSLRPKLKRTNHTIEIRCPEDLEYDSYPGALAQIMTNLIINTLIHGYDNGDEGRIIIDVKVDHNYLIVKYSDEGKGIEKEVLDRIYDPFFTTTRGHGGSGLGLHLVHNLVTQRLKGSIRCESEIGQGTTFYIHLPIKVDP